MTELKITNKDFHGDHCSLCNQPIYETSVGLEGIKQWVHVFTGSHYCNSVFPQKGGVATPKQE